MMRKFKISKADFLVPFVIKPFTYTEGGWICWIYYDSPFDAFWIGNSVA